MRIYITGDRHGKLQDLKEFCKKQKTTNKDVLIILGDVGINYFVNPGNIKKYKNSEYIENLKKEVSELPITIFCVHGNHEPRPETMDSYQEIIWNNGIVYVENEFPNLLFAKDGEIYTILNRTFLVLGGAYSVDKWYRLKKYQMGYLNFRWFDDEQMSITTQEQLTHKLGGIKVDYVLSHTCPYSYIPTEMFLIGISQDSVDNSMERWLDIIENRILYISWYCGHWHTNKKIKTEKGELIFKYLHIQRLE